MNTPRTPPRFVPTLTEVVHLPTKSPILVYGNATDAAAPLAHQNSVELEEAIVHRVMQRMDVSLDQHLREAIARVVQEQTNSLAPRLREEVETVIRQSVYEAIAEEMASVAPSAPTEQD